MEPDETSAPRAERFDFLLAALPLVVIAFAFRAYVPFWDGAFYLRCLEDAFGPRHGATFLFCANHPTGGYLTPLAVAFHLAGLRYPAVIAVNVVLGLLGAHAVHGLSAAMLPGAASRVERGLVTLGFALSPLLLACTLQLTPDLGVALFSLLTVHALVRRRFALAAVAGALGSFSKETGAAIYLVTCAAYLLVEVVWRPGDPPAKRRALRPLAPLLLSPALGVAWVAVRLLVRGDRGAWQGVGSQYPLWRQLASVSFLDDVLPSQLAEIFVVNFTWVLAVFIALSAVEPAWRFVARLPAPADDSAAARARLFYALSFAGTVFVVTRFRTLVIPRYVLPAVVLLPLMGQRALHSLRVSPRLRLLLLGGFAGLSLLAVFRTRDAVAMGYFDTFEFGEHRLLDLASRARDLHGRREHLVYNLQFAELSGLLDEALPRALADGRHDLALNRVASWFPIGYVDRRTHRRAASARGAQVPRAWYLADIRREAARPPRLYYVEMPGMDDEDELIVWRQFYRVGAPITFERNGYTLAMHELVLRADAAPPAPAPTEL